MKTLHSSLCAIALAATCTMAQAADTASVNILGFSADGSTFAFEEYGIQDGSGFPYANRYYINTANDSFLPGTPVRVRVDEDGASLADARAQAKSQSQSIISDAVLAANPGFTAGWNAVTELSADPHRIEVDPRPIFPSNQESLDFRLTELPMPDGADCYGFGEAAGFRLIRVATTPGSETTLVHEDSAIPQSRGCPLGYRIAGVQTFDAEYKPSVFAVMIAVRRVGFEGPDHRFIAVTGQY